MQISRLPQLSGISISPDILKVGSPSIAVDSGSIHGLAQIQHLADGLLGIRGPSDFMQMADRVGELLRSIINAEVFFSTSSKVTFSPANELLALSDLNTGVFKGIFNLPTVSIREFLALPAKMLPDALVDAESLFRKGIDLRSSGSEPEGINLKLSNQAVPSSSNLLVGTVGFGDQRKSLRSSDRRSSELESRRWETESRKDKKTSKKASGSLLQKLKDLFSKIISRK